MKRVRIFLLLLTVSMLLPAVHAPAQERPRFGEEQPVAEKRSPEQKVYSRENLTLPEQLTPPQKLSPGENLTLPEKLTPPQKLSPAENLSFQENPITHNEFVTSVIQGNLGYIAEQLDLSIAAAEYRASKALPDPELSLSYANNEERRLEMGQSVEGGISYPVSLGNRRGAGVRLARTQYEMTELMLDATLQSLKAEASLAYYDALRCMQIYSLQKEIQEQLEWLAGSDSIRYSKGEAARLDALQTSLEARAQKTETEQSYADLQSALVTLNLLAGNKVLLTPLVPSDNFPVKNNDYDLNSLVSHAVEMRADLLAAIKNREVSEKYLKLLKAERSPEVNLEAGYAYNTIVRNEIAPAPAFNSVSAGLSFPIKFSSLNRGEVKAATLEVEKSNRLYEETELQVTAEVIRAYNEFMAQNRKVEQYDKGLISDAEEILNGRIYAYQRGESGLAEVIHARRTYSELKLNYVEVLYDYTAALIELERAAGLWSLTE